MLKILVVDDEKVQRESLCRGLTLLGYECHSAAAGEEALAQLRQVAARPFELMVTDQTMPGLSGVELIERARGLQPALRVLLITGLLADHETQMAQASGIPVLRKPFNLEQLEAAIWNRP